jgi:hypothetical protein
VVRKFLFVSSLASRYFSTDTIERRREEASIDDPEAALSGAPSWRLSPWRHSRHRTRSPRGVFSASRYRLHLHRRPFSSTSVQHPPDVAMLRCSECSGENFTKYVFQTLSYTLPYRYNRRDWIWAFQANCRKEDHPSQVRRPSTKTVCTSLRARPCCSQLRRTVLSMTRLSR